MSATQRVKQGFLRLPLAKKLLLIASFTLMISAVLPWYDNKNTFGSGETYLGFQGPLFMVGFLILGLGAANFLSMFLPLLGKNFSKMRKNSGLLSMILGAQAALLLVVGNTVFYHPQFGENASHKATGFGMTVAFLSIGTMIIAGWWAKRKESSGEYEKREQEIAEAEAAAEAERAAQPVQVMQSQPMQQRPMPSSYNAPAPQPAQPVQTYQPVQPERGPGADVDPLTLDAKTRYKLMKQRMRQSETARGNYWGAKPAAEPYGANRSERRLP
jgi:hypothetical protein